MKDAITFAFFFILSLLTINVFSQSKENDSAQIFPSIYIAEDVSNAAALSPQVLVYPSYTSGLIYVDFGAAVEKANSFEVFDVSGTLMFREDVFGNKVKMNLSELPEGIYFIKIRRSNVEETKKIILKKEAFL